MLHILGRTCQQINFIILCTIISHDKQMRIITALDQQMQNTKNKHQLIIYKITLKRVPTDIKPACTQCPLKGEITFCYSFKFSVNSTSSQILELMVKENQIINTK